MKRWLIGLMGLILVMVLGVGCASAAPTGTPTSVPTATATIEGAGEVEEVTFNELFSSPDQYNGRYIFLEGFYFQGWETIVLSEKLEYTGYAKGHLWPRGQMIWIEGSIPREAYDKLYQQEMMGPSERYGKLRIKGRFEYGAKYGHVGGFSAQIIPLEVKLLTWFPPPIPEATLTQTSATTPSP